MTRKYHEGDEPVPGSGYRLTEFLGQGGFGEVWKATAPGGAEAALKIIQLGGTEGRKEFRALQLVKRIRHTHLVPIFSFWLKNAEGGIIEESLVGTVETIGEETAPPELRATMAPPSLLPRPQPAELIIAMGLGDKSLFDRLRECLDEGREGIPQEEILHYLEDAAEAIDFLNRPLHNLGSGLGAIQHCDIKPHNLMIVGSGAQVCDFGLARLMGADRTTTAAATIAYAAPECLVEGKPSNSTDQYSLAVTYYELKTGVLPYRDETLAAVMDAKRSGTLDFSRVSSAVQSVLRRATSPKPADRFSSATEMVNALKSAVADAGQVSATSHKPIWRNRLAVLFVVMFLIVLGWGVSFMIPHKGSPVPEHDNTLVHRNPENDTKPPIDPAEKPLSEAKTLVEKKQWSAALEKCEEAIGLNPNSAKAYYLRGRCRANLEPVDYDKAIGDYAKAKSLGSGTEFPAAADFAEVYRGRGTDLLRSKRYDEAIADLDQAGRYAPRDDRVFSRLGAAWFNKGQLQKAIEAFAASIAINPGDPTDFVNRGNVYRNMDQFDRALADYSHAVQLDPKNAAAQLQLGKTHLDLKQPAKAIEPLDKAIEELVSSPDSDEKNMLAEAYRYRGIAHLGSVDAVSGGTEEIAAKCRASIADLTAAARLYDWRDLESLASVHETRMGCYAAIGEKDSVKAEKDIVEEMQKAIKTPDDADPLNDLAYYLATSTNSDIRDIAHAIDFSKRALRVGGLEKSRFSRYACHDLRRIRQVRGSRPMASKSPRFVAEGR